MRTHALALAIVVASFFMPVVELKGDLSWIQDRVAPFVQRVASLDPIVEDPPGTFRVDLPGRGRDDPFHVEDERLDGWECADLQARFVTGATGTELDRRGLRDLGEVLWTALANPLYLAAVILAWRRRWWRSFGLAACAVASAAWWMYGTGIAAYLEPGYWVWIGGMTLAALTSLVCGVLWEEESRPHETPPAPLAGP